MQFMMRDERLKVQAFRFVDALPTMSSSRDVARHLREYFVLAEGPRDDGDTPPPLAQFASRLMNFSSTESLWARLMAGIAQRGAAIMASQFIAGSNPREAERAIVRMRGQRLAFTIDVLGEAALSRREADAYHATYLELIDRLADRAAEWEPCPGVDEGDGRAVPRVNVSVKLTAIHPGLDPLNWERSKEIGKERLRPILRRGVRRGAHIHVDMEHYAVKDLTLELCRELFAEAEFRDYPHFGIVLQAYLRDIDGDVRDTVAYAQTRGAPLWVRLVKGAYWDTETLTSEQAHWPCPVFEQKWQSDAAYERAAGVLLENWRHTPVALASHNVRSLSRGLALRQALEVPGHAFELQALYGMGDPIKHALADLGQRCRVYTPYGPMLAGMAYLIRRLLENTANESFLRHTSAPDASWDALLEAPESIGRRAHPPVRVPLIRLERGEPLMDPFENVADSDFSRADVRRRMTESFRRVQSLLPLDVPLRIGAERVDTGRTFESRNPSRPDETVARAVLADEGAVARAAAVADAAFRSWRRVSPFDRAEFLFAAGRLMQHQRFDLAALIGLEVGKPWREADAEVSEAIDFCNYYAGEMLRMAEPQRRRDVPGETNSHHYASIGVVAVLGTWSFPLSLLTGMTTAAIVTGNTVVVKPASAAPAIAYRLFELLREAGIPDGVVNFIAGPGASIGAALVRRPEVALVAVTGSRQTGQAVHRLAAEHPSGHPAIKPVLAEMGGKNAIIVDSDADLDEAIKGVVTSAFSYAGQKCTSCSRVIVLSSIYDRFIERLADSVSGLSMGPASDPGTFVPPLIDAEARRRVSEYVELGKREARCVLEVAPPAGLVEGAYVGPVIFADVPPDSRVAREEIFGPVLCVLRAETIEHAIELFNRSDYGLTGGLYSRSPASIELARDECECGTFYINRRITGSKVDLQPFGGLRMSGLGARVGGPDYLPQFCQARTVAENTQRRGFAPREEEPVEYSR